MRSGKLLRLKILSVKTPDLCHYPLDLIDVGMAKSCENSKDIVQDFVAEDIMVQVLELSGGTR